MSGAPSLLKKYRWPIILAVVAVFLFYWYEVRPVFIYRRCTAQASMDARTLLASKAELSKGTEQGEAYAGLIAKNLYLRSDYESFLTKCLAYHGLQIMPLDEESMPAEAVPTGTGAAGNR